MSIFNFDRFKKGGNQVDRARRKAKRRVMFSRPLINEERLKELDL